MKSLSKPTVVAFRVLANQLASAKNALELGPSCDEPDNPYGLFDFRTAYRGQKQSVERAYVPTAGQPSHRGSAAPAVGHAIQDALAVFPNRPRSLEAMYELIEKEGQDPLQGNVLPIKCRLERSWSWGRPHALRRLLGAEDAPGRGRRAAQLRRRTCRHERIQAVLRGHDRHWCRRHSKGINAGSLRHAPWDRLQANSRLRKPEAEAVSSAIPAAAVA